MGMFDDENDCKVFAAQFTFDPLRDNFSGSIIGINDMIKEFQEKNSLEILSISEPKAERHANDSMVMILVSVLFQKRM